MHGLIEETIEQQGMTDWATAMTGDFLQDDIGSGYDLIICYGNMHPKLTWERTKTLGHGGDVCDFKVRIRKN